MNDTSRKLYPELFVEPEAMGGDAFINWEIDRLRWVEDQSITSLIRTVARSSRFARPLPQWATVAVIEILKEGPQKKGRGRNNSPEGREQQRQIDLDRWFAVYQIKHGASGVAERIERDGHGITWEAVYETVSELLRGEPSWGSPRAIKDSYVKMKQQYVKSADFSGLEDF